MGQSKASKQKLTAKQREVESLKLRMSGATYLQIGNALGITEQGAYAAVMRALKKLNAKVIENAEELRRLEIERLDRLLLAFWTNAIAGNEKAADRVLRIMERRAKLLGLDSPEKYLDIDVSQLTDEQLDRLIAGEDVFRVLATPS